MNRFLAIFLAVIAAAPALASPQEAVAAVLADVRRLPPEVACRTRYLYDEPKIARVVKFWANSLSREVEFGNLRPVGAGVLAASLDDYQWSELVWDKFINGEPFFYYLLRDRGPDGRYYLSAVGKEITERTHSRIPIVWSDWWLFYTSRQINLDNKETGAGYYDFLGIKDQTAFERLRFTDRKVAIQIGDELAAVLEEGRSRVSQKDRRIEWVSTYGDGDQGLWLTRDVDDSSNGNTATGKLADGELREAAREAFIGLPNRLWGVGAFDAKGTRQATVPDKIATDNSPLHRGNDRRIHPFSCFHCHTNGGLQAVDDWARNRGLRAPNQLEAFKLTDYQRLKRQFFRDIDKQLAKGRARYAEALKECVQWKPEEAAQAHALAYYNYLRPRTTADVAALLGVTEDCLLAALKAYFVPLNPDAVGKKKLAGFLPLLVGEAVPIKLVEDNFGELRCIVGGHK